MQIARCIYTVKILDFFSGRGKQLNNVENKTKQQTPTIMYDIRGIPIAQYPMSIGNEDLNTKTQRIIIAGGFGKNESRVHELVSKQTANGLEINCQDTGIDLVDIGCKYGLNVISLITSDSSKLITIRPYNGIYNVYSFGLKSWMINDDTQVYNKSQIFNLGCIGQRYLFINDDILIISYKKQLHFYNMSNVLEPQLIQIHTITSKIPGNSKDGYINHGICMINYQFSKDCKELFSSIIVFGGYGHIPFESSFIQFDIVFDYCLNSNNCNEMNINAQIIENKIYQVNLFQVSKNILQLYHFACHCVNNDKNEKIIMIIGGLNEGSYESGNCVFLYNVSTSTLTESQTVWFFFSCYV